jgi:hypothetical protein
MNRSLYLDRRTFLRRGVAGATALAMSRIAFADEGPRASEHTLTEISGNPRERGRQYGEKFQGAIGEFVDRQIYDAFAGEPAVKEAMLRYAGKCLKPIKELSPIVLDEMEGMAEGSGRKLEELVLLSLHEELYHRGAIPSVDHCHVVAAGPPATIADAYVGQTWDWMASVYGLSSMLLWKRPEGPSLLAYSYPGLWVGAGLNSAGIAHCWTSAFNDKDKNPGPRVGVPSYAMIAHLLYQETLEAVAEEARRDKHAGWFTFVFADGEGNLLNVEGSPSGVAVEQSRGIMVRHQYGSRRMSGAGQDDPIPLLGSSPFLVEQLEARRGKLEATDLQGALCHENVGKGALDIMLFNTTRREAHLARGPGPAARWRTFRFPQE